MTNLGKRAAAFISDRDPFGDHFSAHDLAQLDPTGGYITVDLPHQPMKVCPNCNDANSCGDYEGPTCEVCHGEVKVPDTTATNSADAG